MADVEEAARDFARWVTHNEFTDPENIFVCAEWLNLCHALGLKMQGAGSVYREKNAASHPR